MKIYASCNTYHFGSSSYPIIQTAIETHLGVDFVDADYASYSKDIDAPSGAFTATLTVEREPYAA